MKREFSIVLPVILLVISFSVFAAEEHLLPLQGTAKLNAVNLPVGDIIIEMYDAPSGGNLIYNSSADFLGTIRNGKYDILLGNGTQPLSLKYGTKYYMDMYVNGTDLDFNSSERQVFMSTVGNISITTPIHTNSTDADDALNISAGGAFIRGNVVVNNFFNISSSLSEVRTNGTVAITSNDADDALNVTVGGVRIGGKLKLDSALSPAFSLNGFNISGADASVSTNGSILVNNLFNVTASNGNTDVGGTLDVDGKVTFVNSDADDALNVTVGGVRIGGKLKLDTALNPAFSLNGFNISGADASVSTNGSILINNLFNVTASSGNTEVGGTLDVDGKVTFVNSDTDDALNISAGGAFIRGNVVINNFFNISSSLSEVRTNGTVAITNNDKDDALNVTLGGAFIRGNVVINNFFNISSSLSEVQTNGTVAITSNDADDALNVTVGGVRIGGKLKLDSALSPAFSLNGFNISGADASVSTNGSILVNNLFNVTASNGNTDVGGTLEVDGKTTLGGALEVNGKAAFVNSDTDDALNISAGGAFIRGNVVVNNFFNISSSLSEVQTNGTVAITNNDKDDALNVTVGGAFIRGNVVINNFFNISSSLSEVRTNGTVIITSTAEDALNVSAGSAQIGWNGSTTQSHLDIFGGGTNKCSYLVLYNETGGPNYLFVTNQTLRISDAIPSVCDNTEGHAVGNATYGGV